MVFFDGDMICGVAPRGATRPDIRKGAGPDGQEWADRMRAVLSHAYVMHLDDPNTCIDCGQTQGRGHRPGCTIDDNERFLELATGEKLPWNEDHETDDW